ncbi:MAG TPA: chromate resistance protein ChrB domain-containing protein [Candidatus Bathyarchaeia archaeon]|nr:chromate resistance protein ChrB domain-containing protein [Candidatus Bathyarchaeia archaeon]
MLWVTRHNPHVDRCASAWLVKRFIDKKARFAFVLKMTPYPKEQ